MVVSIKPCERKQYFFDGDAPHCNNCQLICINNTNNLRVDLDEIVVVEKKIDEVVVTN